MAGEQRSLQIADAGTRRIFSIPAGTAFLDGLARATLAGEFSATGAAPDPAALPAMRILLPTQRAVRALQDAYLRAVSPGADGIALLLPSILPIADGDATASLIAGVGALSGDAFSGAVPSPMPNLHRRLVLTRFVLQWFAARTELSAADLLAAPGQLRTPAEAAGLATGLATLMDMLETEGVASDGLAGLVPESLAAHWQLTLDFLQIVTATWPAYLTATGLISPAGHRNRLLALETARLGESTPSLLSSPVIVAGVTGSIPATLALMRVVAERPGGALVLPGVDLDLDEASWLAAAGDPAHPQFRLSRLLMALGIDRDAVTMLPGTEPPHALSCRNRFIGEAMRPASTTAEWGTLTARLSEPDICAALDGVTLLEAASAEEEAEAIALILRHAAEQPGVTAALVTPDRILARRVETRLRGWGIAIDDSAGRPFAKTVPGAFLDLVLEAFASHFAPAAVMALLKHPLTRLGLEVGPARRAARMLELAAFRRTYLGDGLAGIAAALHRAFPELPDADDDDLERAHRAARKMAERDRASARDLLTRLTVAMQPLTELQDLTEPSSLAALAQAHLAAASAIACDEAGKDDALYSGEAGAALDTLFVGLSDPAIPALPLQATDYRDFYRALIAGESVRTRAAVHPRLSIWGPFEARLQRPDIVILGGLVDGVWPEIADPDPWLNRPMLAALGLPAPEARIGDAAHDFTQMLGAAKVYLTRAAKVDGVPKVASRWLLRIRALLMGLKGDDPLKADAPWLAWAKTRIAAGTPVATEPPRPCPPLAVRPRQMSVTRVETWMRNPYAIYASRILSLEPMPELGHQPDDRLRGTMIHAVLSRFTQTWPDQLPDDIGAAMRVQIDRVLKEHQAHPRVAAFWRPRLIRFADWFAATEAARRIGVSTVLTEVPGSLDLAMPGGDFALTARADRLDLLTGGQAIITDYKSGNAPKPAQVESLKSPQLPLEAAILIAGGFVGSGARAVAAIRYISAKGGDPPGDEMALVVDIATLAARGVEGVKQLVAAFDDVSMPYAALRRPGFTYHFDDYAHLARVKAWENAGQMGDDGDE